jgi:hypothetical protein
MMRGTKAKKLRKEVYGDTSLRIERKYVGGEHGWHAFAPQAPIRNHPDSPRAKYQLAKKGA